MATRVTLRVMFFKPPSLFRQKKREPGLGFPLVCPPCSSLASSLVRSLIELMIYRARKTVNREDWALQGLCVSEEGTDGQRDGTFGMLRVGTQACRHCQTPT